jgi:hypothetical protein
MPVPNCGTPDTHAEILGLSGMFFYRLKSLAGRRSSPIFDGAVLTIVTLAALFYCYDVEVFPDDSKPHTLELDELLLVSTIFCGGLFICALRRLAEQRRWMRRVASKLPPVTGLETVPPLLFYESRAKCEAGSIENFGSRFEAIEVRPFSKQSGLTPVGRPSRSADIEMAIEALAAEGVDLSKLPRKDAYVRIRQKAAELGTSVELGFSPPVVRKVLIRRFGPRF